MNKVLPATVRNKVGIDDETRSLLQQLKQETGIPHARLVRDAMKHYAPKLRRRNKAAAA